MKTPVTVADFTSYLEANKNFHRELWRLAKSHTLFRELEHVCRIPFAAPEALVFGAADPEQIKASAYVAAEQHRAIVEAIENREGTRAEALAREHSRISRLNLELTFRTDESTHQVPGLSLVSR